jgi:hypothetical protein
LDYYDADKGAAKTAPAPKPSAKKKALSKTGR